MSKYGIVEHTSAGDVYKHIERADLKKLYVNVPKDNTFTVVANEETIITINNEEVIVSRPKRPRPIDEDEDMIGGFSDLPLAKRSKKAESDESLASEDERLSFLNTSIKGRLEILETYWIPVFEKIRSDDTINKLVDLQLLCRTAPSDRKGFDYDRITQLNTAGGNYSQGVSIPFPSRKDLDAALANPNCNFPKAINPYLTLEKSCYKDYVEAFVYYQLVMFRLCVSAFSCGDVNDYLVDMMRYSVLKDWELVKRFQKSV